MEGVVELGERGRGGGLVWCGGLRGNKREPLCLFVDFSRRKVGRRLRISRGPGRPRLAAWGERQRRSLGVEAFSSRACSTAEDPRSPKLRRKRQKDDS